MDTAFSGVNLLSPIYIGASTISTNIGTTPTIFYLSESQHNLAREVFEENKEKTGIQLSKESHEFPEWNDPMGSSNFLDYKELLQVLGKSNEEIERITEELRNETILENMLG